MADPNRVLSYASLKFNSGREVETPEAGLVIFVGPNNVGKTTSVLELHNRIQGGVLQHNYPNVMFESAELRKVDDQVFNDWVERHLDGNYQPPPSRPQMRRYRNWGHRVDVEPTKLLNHYKQMSSNNQVFPLLHRKVQVLHSKARRPISTIIKVPIRLETIVSSKNC